MEKTNPQQEEEVGILFIYESDGLEWTQFIMNILQAEPYKIRCLHKLCWDLKKELTERCSILVLIFTPELEKKASSLNFDLLQPNSMHSCIIECNGEVSKTDMPNWQIMYTLAETLESQRDVLTRLIGLYEGVTGNRDDVNVNIDNILIMDVVPAVLYPGQEEVYVIFNYEEEAEVTVYVQGLSDRLTTQKCTKTVHVFNMPNTCKGKNYVSIFVGDQKDPVFSTNIKIISAENLAESLTFNLRRIQRPTHSKEEENINEAVYNDPFSEAHCTDDTLNKCWSTLKELVKKDLEPAKPRVRIQNEEDEQEIPTVVRRRSSKLNRVKTFFQKMFKNDPTVNRVNMNKRTSRRILRAKSQKMTKCPRLPQGH